MTAVLGGPLVMSVVHDSFSIQTNPLHFVIVEQPSGETQADLKTTKKDRRSLSIMAESEYSAWHTYWSYLKSAIRIVACVAGMLGSLSLFAIGMLIAEVVGIIEEAG